MNFGIPAPIDIQVTGRDPKGYEIANEIKQRVAQIPGAADVHVHQVVHGPDLRVNVDRTRAQQIGLSQNDVARTMLISLSSSGQASPNFWLNFQNGVNYQVAVQTPQYKMGTLQDLKNTPVVAPNLPRPELLGNLATVERRESPIIVNHYDVQPVFDVLANVQGRDLGGVADQINKIVDQTRKNLPRGTFLSARGQVDSMNKSFAGIGTGILFAVVFVYFLMAVNFQSWTDPFIIIMALPARCAASSGCSSLPAPRSTCRRSRARSWPSASRQRTAFWLSASPTTNVVESTRKIRMTPRFRRASRGCVRSQ